MVNVKGIMSKVFEISQVSVGTFFWYFLLIFNKPCPVLRALKTPVNNVLNYNKLKKDCN